MKKLILLIATLLIFFSVYAEKKIVSGKVLLNNEFTLGNIKISAKKSKARVSTNMEGEYSIACEDKDVLVFEADLLKTVKKSVRGKDSLNVSMTFKAGSVDKDKITKLNYFQTTDIDAIIKAVNNSNYDFSHYTSVSEIIKTKFPFVRKTGSSYVIRASNSIKEDDAALCVVDGIVVSDFASVDPSQVKLVKVLNSSDASLYGLRGINGVIEVYTK